MSIIVPFLVLASAPVAAADAGLPAADPALLVSRDEREAEAARLRDLGLSVPDGGPVLERPWAEPFGPRSLVVPQAWFRTPGPDAGVDADALARDLPILEEIMRRAYGGWDSARARGWDWGAWFQQWRGTLQSRQGTTLPLVEAFSPVKQLMAFQLDNHTNLPLGRETMFGSGSQSALLEGTPKGGCTELRTSDFRTVALDPKDPAQRVRTARRWSPSGSRLETVRYLSVPGSRGQLAAVRCGGAWTSLTPVWPPAVRFGAQDADQQRARLAPILAIGDGTSDEPQLKLLVPTVAYMRLPTFTKRTTQLLEERAWKWMKPTDAERVLIVDLRDNEGGDVAVEALEKWVDLKRLEPAFSTHRRQGASCLYPSLRWGYAEVTSRGLKAPLGKEVQSQLQGGLDALFRPAQPGCPPKYEESHGGWEYRKHAMRPPGPVDGRRRILVLVNDGTGSDGELMAILLASLPETVVAGSNTFGVGQFIQPGYSVLPHTRLPFRIALGTNDPYGDGRSFDGYGLDVDIVLPTEAAQSPEAIVELARYIGG